MRSTVRWAAFAILAVVAIALAAGILGSTVEVGGSSGLSSGSGGDSGDSGQSGGLFENNESSQATQSLPINFPQQQISLCVSPANDPAVLLGLGAAYLLVGSIVARLRTKLLGITVVMIAVYVTVIGALLLTIGCNPPDLSFDGGGGLGAGEGEETEGDEGGTGGDDADGPETIPAVLTVALLAGVGTGNWSSVEEACESAISITSECANKEENSRFYRELYPVFQKLYNSLEDDFDLITRKVEELY